MERDEKAMLIEAVDLLRDVWNRGLLDNAPELKERIAEFLEVEDGDAA